MKKIVLELGVVKCNNTSIITTTLFERIKETVAQIENSPGIDILWKEQNNDIWDIKRFDFDLFDNVPNIVIIKDIWVPEELRHTGICNMILQDIGWVLGKDSLIFAYVGISEREYSPLRYSVTDEHDGRIVLDRVGIIRHLLKYFQKCGYLEVSGYTNASPTRSIMLFAGPMGSIAKQYMEGSIVTKGAHGEKKLKQIYRDLFYHIIAMGEDDNITMVPWVEEGTEPLCPIVAPEMIEVLEKNNPSWYSKKLYDTSDPSQSEIERSAAISLRSMYMRIGGAEVHFEDPIKDFPTPSDVYIKATPDNQYYVDENTVESAIDIYDDFLYNKNSDYVLMRGFILTSDGIWSKGTWLYDSTQCRVIDWLYIPTESILAYVGHIDSVATELV